MAWGISIRQRVQQKSARRSLLAVSALLVFWIILRACKYRYFDSLDACRRYLWYGYYIPQLFAPVFGLRAALCLCLLSFFGLFRAYQLLELFCATYAAAWEACIQIGLVSSNTNYKGFFSVSTIAAQLSTIQRGRGAQRALYAAPCHGGRIRRNRRGRALGRARRAA